MTFPKNSLFGNVFRYPSEFGPKTKMVRVVHVNIFYRMDLEVRDSKSESLMKAEISGFRKIGKFSFGVQNGLLRLF